MAHTQKLHPLVQVSQVVIALGGAENIAKSLKTSPAHVYQWIENRLISPGWNLRIYRSLLALGYTEADMSAYLFNAGSWEEMVIVPPVEPKAKRRARK